MSNLGKRPTVSVVIATFNRSAMAKAAVCAAWNQTYRPDEIVVSDDCSTDDTVSVLYELQSEIPILRVIESRVNSGGVPNWNKVIDASTGDLVAWCSDDDRFIPEHIEHSVQYLEDHEHVGLVHSGFEEVREDRAGVVTQKSSSLKSKVPVSVTRENIIEYMTTNYGWPFHPSTLVFRRTLWEQTGSFNPAFALADTDWFIRAAAQHTLVYLPYLGSINRRHTGDSRNWSVRVGSLNMQREFYAAIHMFVSAAGASEDGPKFAVQLRRWVTRYRVVLLRLYVSRSRAGNLSLAKQCAAELSDVTPMLRIVPVWISTPLADICSVFLKALQRMLPGGRDKYRDLGKYVPM